MSTLGKDGPAPKRKRSAGAFSKEDKELILSTYNGFRKVTPNALVSRLVQKTCKAIGISESSVYNVMREYRSNLTFSAPKISKERRKVSDNIDIYDKSTILREVHKFYFRNDLPTVSKVLSVVNGTGNLPTFKRTTFYKLLKELNFKAVRHAQESALFDREEVVTARAKYLRTMKALRQKNATIYYLGEAWLHSPEPTTRPSKNVPESNNLFAAHIGNEDGFVNGALFLQESETKSVDVSKYEAWFIQKVLPKLKPSSTVVCNGAPYHTRKERVPNMSWPKEEIIVWLINKDISFDEDMLKAELIQLVREYRDKNNASVLEEKAKEHGITLLKLPPYHFEMNPMEYVWTLVRNRLSMEENRDGGGGEPSQVGGLSDEERRDAVARVMGSIGQKEWNKYVNHVAGEVESRMWELDRRMETAIEPLLTSVQYESMDSDSFSDDGS